jgi:hypothetical protein
LALVWAVLSKTEQRLDHQGEPLTRRDLDPDEGVTVAGVASSVVKRSTIAGWRCSATTRAPARAV